MKMTLELTSKTDLDALLMALAECLDATSEDQQRAIFAHPKVVESGERLLSEIRENYMTMLHEGRLTK